jgi:hypothetical protein
MHIAAKSKIQQDQLAPENADLSSYVPEELADLGDPQTAIPRIAKDPHSIRLIERAVHQVPTSHSLHCGDAREMPGLEPHSVHLVLTSPPYWTLKEYRDSEGQLGHVEDYDQFLQELDKVWKHCFQALVPGGRLICVVGDVCLSRRENGGRHTVVPLKGSFQRAPSRPFPRTCAPIRLKSRNETPSPNVSKSERIGEPHPNLAYTTGARATIRW